MRSEPPSALAEWKLVFHKCRGNLSQAKPEWASNCGKYITGPNLYHFSTLSAYKLCLACILPDMISNSSICLSCYTGSRFFISQNKDLVEQQL